VQPSPVIAVRLRRMRRRCRKCRIGRQRRNNRAVSAELIVFPRRIATLALYTGVWYKLWLHRRHVYRQRLADAAKVGAVTLTDGNGGVLRGSAAPVSGGGDLINCGSADDGDGDTTSDD